MSEQTFTINVNVKELLTQFIPKLAGIYLQMRGLEKELSGTELTLTVDVSGALYSYHIKDGVNFDVKEGAIQNPMVHLSIPLDSMAKLADMGNIDLLINMQDQLSRDKYAILSGLKGTSIFKMKHADGSVSEIGATFNGAQSPKATLSLSMEDANKVSSKKESPIQLFLGGKLSIDGEMAFALGLQPLFA